MVEIGKIYEVPKRHRYFYSSEYWRIFEVEGREGILIRYLPIPTQAGFTLAEAEKMVRDPTLLQRIPRYQICFESEILSALHLYIVASVHNE